MLQSWCRECFAEYGRDYYRRNRDSQKSRLLRNVAATRAENRRRIIEYLATHPCVDCGETDIIVLEFDHLGDKVANVSTYANGGRTWPRIEAEIEKCEVRCANCHRRKTRATLFPPSNSVESRQLVPRPNPPQLTLDAALGIRTCRVCKEAKPLTEFLPAGIHEGLVSPKPDEAHRGGLRATSPTSEESRTQNPRLPQRSPLCRLRRVRPRCSRL